MGARFKYGFVPRTRAQRYHEYRAQGRCVKCGKEAVTGKCHCLECAGKAARLTKKYKDMLVASSRCYYCGEPFEPSPISGGRKTIGCAECRAFNTAKRVAKRLDYQPEQQEA